MKEKYPIPALNVKGDLYRRLMVNILGGFWKVLEDQGINYFHLLCSLIDKAVYEYNFFYNYSVEEIKRNDPLSYRLKIIWHLENCINTINRADRILSVILNKTTKGKKQRILQFIVEKTANHIIDYKIGIIRNRIEHIEQDIFQGKIKGSILVNIDKSYSFISVNNRKLLLVDLVSLIGNFHKLVLEIQSKLPNKIEGDTCYYPDGRVEYLK
jgi:hypothetical protein